MSVINRHARKSLGRILNLSTRNLVPLRSHHILGRDPDRSDTWLEGRLISRIHAAIDWNGEHWQIRDLSRNGTWLDGQRLPVGEPVPLFAGQAISLGEAAGLGLQMLEDSEPSSMLLNLSGREEPKVLSGYLLLPTEADPELAIYYSRKEGTWMQSKLTGSELDTERMVLNHGDIVYWSDEAWRLFLADTSKPTPFRTTLETPMADCEFIFDISLDEEHTRLKINWAEQVTDLGDRAHHYLLAHLARLRAEQAEQGLAHKSQGWVASEDLGRQLGCEKSHLNIMIHRARKQISMNTHERIDPECLVERMQGKLRFGDANFRIYKGDKLAYKMSHSRGTAHLAG